MDWHPTDDELMWLAGCAPEEPSEAAVAAHVVSCTRCRDIVDEIRAVAALVREAPVPEPAASFERTMWMRVRTALGASVTTSFASPPSPVASPAAASPRPWSWHQWSWMGAWAAVVAVIASGTVLTRPARSGSAPAGTIGSRASVAATRTAMAAGRAASPGGSPRERVLLTALNDHFSEAEMLLVELRNAPASPERDFERSAAGDLVASGRLYRETARQTGDWQLADVLDDLEGVLVEVARSPDVMSAIDLTSMRARIDDDNLLFKVRAATTDIHDRQHRSIATAE
jgi:hypothetical protein